MDLLFALVGALSGIVAGLGGPGGIPVIGLLYTYTDLSTAELAGTTSTIFFFATVSASLMYYYSGDVDLRTVLPLAPTTFIGTWIGTWLNGLVSRTGFGLMASTLIVLIGLNVVYREYKGLDPLLEPDLKNWSGRLTVAGIGLVVGLIGGMFGIGGPAISIPLLIFIGVPALEAVGAGLVQGILVTSSTALSYSLKDAISSELAIFIGVPYVLSQIVGWGIAQRVEARNLKIALGLMLALLGPYIYLTV